MLFTAVHRPHRLGSKNSEPVWTGEVFLTAHLHKDLTEHTHTHTKHTHIYTRCTAAAADGREV